MNHEKDLSMISLNKDHSVLNDLMKDLNSKISTYENTIKVLENENKNEQSSVTDEMSENYNLIKELNQEKEDYEKRLEVLKKENKILSNQVQLIENQSTDKESNLTKISLENIKLKK